MGAKRKPFILARDESPTGSKTGNRELVSAYCTRLKEVAGFGFVAHPLAMRNSRQATVYYLIFAGPNKTGWQIVQDIYRKYETASS